VTVSTNEEEASVGWEVWLLLALLAGGAVTGLLAVALLAGGIEPISRGAGTPSPPLPPPEPGRVAAGATGALALAGLAAFVARTDQLRWRGRGR